MFLKYRCLTTQLARTERPVEPEMLSFGVLARQLQRTPKQNQIRGTEGSWTLALVPPYNSINQDQFELRLLIAVGHTPSR